MREIAFYRTESGRCPVEDFLDSHSDKKVEKVLWVLRIVREFDSVPKQYFKKLEGSDDIWEVRVKIGGETFRLLGFFDGAKLIVLTNAFAKKTQKVPRKEIQVAEQRKQDYLRRK
jgi:phage-related protein